MGFLTNLINKVVQVLPTIGNGVAGAITGAIHGITQQGDSLLSMSSPNRSKHMKTVANLYRGQFLRYHNMKPMGPPLGLIRDNPNLLPTTQNMLRQLNEKRSKLGLQPFTGLPAPQSMGNVITSLPMEPLPQKNPADKPPSNPTEGSSVGDMSISDILKTNSPEWLLRYSRSGLQPMGTLSLIQRIAKSNPELARHLNLNVKSSSMSANTWTLSQFLKKNPGFLKSLDLSRQGLLPIQQGLDKQLGSSLFCKECRMTNR